MKKLYFAGGAKFSNLVLTREFGLGILLCCSRNKILVSGAKFATSEGYIHGGILFVFVFLICVYTFLIVLGKFVFDTEDFLMNLLKKRFRKASAKVRLG